MLGLITGLYIEAGASSVSHLGYCASWQDMSTMLQTSKRQIMWAEFNTYFSGDAVFYVDPEEGDWSMVVQPPGLSPCVVKEGQQFAIKNDIER